MRHPRRPRILESATNPREWWCAVIRKRGEAVTDGREPDAPLRRPRGRHAVPTTPSGEGWRARVASVVSPVAASVEPRIQAAAEWLFERRLHVLIISATVATIAMIGGAVAFISLTGGPRPGDEASSVVDAPRPTSTDRADPDTFGPILPSSRPPSPFGPSTPKATPTPSPDDEGGDPEADEPPVEPTTEPTPTDPAGRDTAPGQTKRPDKPKP